MYYFNTQVHIHAFKNYNVIGFFPCPKSWGFHSTSTPLMHSVDSGLLLTLRQTGTSFCSIDVPLKVTIWEQVFLYMLS